jgi:hypothetical protein
MAASIDVSSLIGRFPFLSTAFIGRVAVKEVGYVTHCRDCDVHRDDLLNYVFYYRGRNGSGERISRLCMRSTVLDDIEPIGRNHSGTERN